MEKNRKLPRIGIIGGAGPMAGLQLAEHIVQICQNKYNCKDDADFPYIILLSFPFVNIMTMEDGNKQRGAVQKQLLECFNTFENNHIDIAAIACNTLHEFLPDLSGFSFRFVHMIEETAYFLKKNEINRSLILCTETSALAGLHQRHFPSEYPDAKNQKHVDEIIDRILAGHYLKEDAEKLAKLARKYQNQNSTPLGVILGCTELPLLANRYSLNELGLHRSAIIDPMVVVAEEICKSVFINSRQRTQKS